MVPSTAAAEPQSGLSVLIKTKLPVEFQLQSCGDREIKYVSAYGASVLPQVSKLPSGMSTLGGEGGGGRVCARLCGTAHANSAPTSSKVSQQSEKRIAGPAVCRRNASGATRQVQRVQACTHAVTSGCHFAVRGAGAPRISAGESCQRSAGPVSQSVPCMRSRQRSSVLAPGASAPGVSAPSAAHSGARAQRSRDSNRGGSARFANAPDRSLGRRPPPAQRGSPPRLL